MYSHCQNRYISISDHQKYTVHSQIMQHVTHKFVDRKMLKHIYHGNCNLLVEYYYDAIREDQMCTTILHYWNYSSKKGYFIKYIVIRCLSILTFSTSSVFVVLTMSKQFTNVPGKLKVGHFTFSVMIIRSDHNIIALYRNLHIKMVYIPLNYIPTKQVHACILSHDGLYLNVIVTMWGFIITLYWQWDYNQDPKSLIPVVKAHFL